MMGALNTVLLIQQFLNTISQIWKKKKRDLAVFSEGKKLFYADF